MSEDTTPPATPEAANEIAAETVADPAGTEAVATATANNLEERIVAAIQEVFDPEIPVNIHALGLIYDVAIADDQQVHVKMTLTSPACPVAGSLPGEVRDKILHVEGVKDAEVEVVWDPVWNPSMMSEAAKLELGMM